MRTALLIALAATALTAAACDNAGTKTAEAPPPATAPPPPAPPPPPPPASIPGLTAPFATEADWVNACINDAKLDKSICDCAGKAVIKEQGQKSLYVWVWEGYIQRVGMGKVRSDKWFADNGIDKAGQQKFADAIGKCYVSK